MQGQRVFITPNTKPGKVIVASLVKAVHGLVCSSSFPLQLKLVDISKVAFVYIFSILLT